MIDFDKHLMAYHEDGNDYRYRFTREEVNKIKNVLDNREEHDRELYNKAINEFADKMIIMMPGHKQDILQIAEQLKAGDKE